MGAPPGLWHLPRETDDTTAADTDNPFVAPEENHGESAPEHLESHFEGRLDATPENKFHETSVNYESRSAAVPTVRTAPTPESHENKPETVSMHYGSECSQHTRYEYHSLPAVPFLRPHDVEPLRLCSRSFLRLSVRLLTPDHYKNFEVLNNTSSACDTPMKMTEAMDEGAPCPDMSKALILRTILESRVDVCRDYSVPMPVLDAITVSLDRASTASDILLLIEENTIDHPFWDTPSARTDITRLLKDLALAAGEPG